MAPTTAQGGSGATTWDGTGASVDAEAAGGAEPSFLVMVLAQDEPWVGSDDPCTYEVMGFADAQATALAYLGIQPDAQLGDATEEGAPELYASPWLLVTCPSPLFGDLLVRVVQLTTSPPPPELPALMESIVRRSMVLRLPQPRFSPDAAGYQITGVETWVWLDPAYAAPITVTGCAGNGFACASMTARFSHLELDMGDLATPFACAGLVATTQPAHPPSRPLPRTADTSIPKPQLATRSPRPLPGTWTGRAAGMPTSMAPARPRAEADPYPPLAARPLPSPSRSATSRHEPQPAEPTPPRRSGGWLDTFG